MVTQTSEISITRRLRVNLRTYAIVVALALIWLLFGALTNWVFLDPRNLSNLFRQMTIEAFLAIGMVLVIVTGNIDLSVGSATGLVSVVVAYLQFFVLHPVLRDLFPTMPVLTLGLLNTIVAVIAGLLVGLVIGIYQGAIIAYLKVPAFIVTLGGMLIFRGGVLAITQGKTISPLEDSMSFIAQGYLSNLVGWIVAVAVVIWVVAAVLRNRFKRNQFGFESTVPLGRDILKIAIISVLVIAFVFIMNLYRGIPNPVLLMVIVAVIFTYIANNTKFGRYTYALGGNKEATRLSGINIDRLVFIVFILIGLMTGISGVVLTGYVAAGTVSGGVNYELEAIAACVIGGTSLMGGEGTIVGALVGALIMSSILNGMSVMDMGVFWQYIVRGVVLIGAVYLDVQSKRNRE